MRPSHHDRVRQQFRLQAPTFAETGFAVRGLEWLIERLSPRADERVLDVAAGAAHLGRALAPLVAQVAAVDLTPEMLVQGHRLAEKSGLKNITFQVGDAARLPWIDEQFDLVVCRLALHQVADPGAVVAEMLRMVRPTGRIGIADLFVPRPETTDEANRIERLRDPSHNRTLTRAEFFELLAAAGADVASDATADFDMDVDDWLDRTQTPPEARARIMSRFEEEIDGGPATGLRPRRGPDGAIGFTHSWLTLTATPRF